MGSSLSSSASCAPETGLPCARKGLGLRLPRVPLGGVFPREFTCDGADVNPGAAWHRGPCGTRSFAVLMDDPDAVPAVGFVFVHWGVVNVPANVLRIRQDQDWDQVPRAVQLRNSFGQIGWGGPCPPPGDPPHRYRFRLYAMSVPCVPLSAADPPTTVTEFEQRFGRWILATGRWHAFYARPAGV